MNYKYPHVALSVLAELATRKGDCAGALIAAASEIGLEIQNQAKTSEFGCGAEHAVASLVAGTRLNSILSEIAQREKDGRLQPCQPDRESCHTNCLQKCPLILDLALQTEKRS